MACITLEILIIMTEYGYIEDGYLRAIEIKPTIYNRKREDGTVEAVEVSVEEQIAELPESWKPVELIDESQMISDDENYIIVAIPYDAGDCIKFRYERKFDRQRIKAEIAALKDSLASTDYRVTKCYEASLLGNTLPYDIVQLHSERQQTRDKINELEALLPEE
ncbi:hypothetical protein [uncultured Bacteroides sp.]|uniref:hypothetical protein n=2 Tax=Bacteroidales TaxID=171549 RepID=UPI00258DD985|nr:hypothetical protein [uncultured Bacteroides sp.]